MPPTGFTVTGTLGSGFGPSVPVFARPCLFSGVEHSMVCTRCTPKPSLMEPTVWEGMELPTGKLAFGRGEQQGDQTAGPRV